MSTRPGMTNLPRPSISRAPAATGVVGEGPSPTIRSPSIEIVVGSSRPRPAPSRTRAPTTASLWISPWPERLVMSIAWTENRGCYQQLDPRPGLPYVQWGAQRRKRGSVPDRGDLPDHAKNRLRLGRLHRRDARKPDEELASTTGPLAVCLHLAAVELHEPAYQREADA